MLRPEGADSVKPLHPLLIEAPAHPAHIGARRPEPPAPPLPKVTRDAFLWELEYTNGVTAANTPLLDKLFHVDADPYAAAEGADAVCILTEWDAFKSLDWGRVFGAMRKPAFVFDGRNILDHAALRALGFEVYAVGKPTASKDGAGSFASPRGGF